MEDRQTLALSLAAGEIRQLLLEAGSTVLVMDGRLSGREPPVWLAESVLTRKHELTAEEAWVVPCTGWVEFSADTDVVAVVIAPERAAFWSQVGLRLARLFGQAGKPRSSSSAQPEV